jgi:hypothetical protein
LTLLEKLRQQLADREIRRRFDQRQEIVAMGVELAALGRTLPARRPIVGLARAAPQTIAVASPIPNRSAAPRADIPARAASITRSRKSWL